MSALPTVNTAAAASSLQAALVAAQASGLPLGNQESPEELHRKQVASIVAIVLVVTFVLLLFVASALKTVSHHATKAGARVRHLCGWMPWIPRELPPLKTPTLGHFPGPRYDLDEKPRTPPASAKSSPGSAKGSPRPKVADRSMSAARQRLQDIRNAKTRYQLAQDAPVERREAEERYRAVLEQPVAPSNVERKRLRGAAGRSVAFDMPPSFDDRR